ncbi:MAG: hypothetical protein EPN20_01025 [Magnetospirillum sp.]|nr:MAG: hypothetical protein EPN20_01025 [Magnetospirillum sp.]
MTTHIHIPDVPPVIQHIADGSQKVFAFPFPIFWDSDLEVRVGTGVLMTGFTVFGAGSSKGGAVVLASAPAAGTRVTLRRKQSYARTDDFLDERAPTPHELNDAVDQTVAAIQELAEQASRSVQRPLSADLSQAVTLDLPVPEAGKVLGWNGSANGLVNIAQIDPGNVLHRDQNLADLPDMAAARTNLGLGSAATHAAGDFASAAQGAKAESALQAADIGVSVQAHDADLDWLAANLSPAGRALVDDTDAAAQRATLGLAAVAASGSYADLSSKPVLGTAAALDVDTDPTLAANSDLALPSQKAIKAYVTASTPTAFRNLVIGGDFTANPWQRGTTGTASLANNGILVADRWFWHAVSGSTTVSFTMKQTADGPSMAQAGISSPTCLELICTTAAPSLSSLEGGGLWYKVEGLHSAFLGWGQAEALPVTLSFWVKSNLTGSFPIGLWNATQTASYCTSYTITAADTWEKKIITVPGAIIGTWRTDNDVGLYLTFGMAVGSTLQTSTPETWISGAAAMVPTGMTNLAGAVSNYVRFNLIQLEAGPAATPFEALPADVVLSRCQRYARSLGFGGSGYVISATNVAFSYSFSGSPMRTPPTLSLLDTTPTIAWPIGAVTGTASTIAASTMTPQGLWVNIGGFSGLTAGQGCAVYQERLFFMTAEL